MILEHILTELMIIDPLTKGLTVKVFVEHVTRMGVMRSFWYISLVGVFSFMYMYFLFGPHLFYCHIIEMIDNNHLLLW